MLLGRVLHDVLQEDDSWCEVGGDGVEADVEIVADLLTDGLEEGEDVVRGRGPPTQPHYHHGTAAWSGGQFTTGADLFGSNSFKLECYHSSLEVNRPRLNWNLVLRLSPKIPVLLEVLIFRSAIMISLVGEQSFIGQIGHKHISQYHSVRVRESGGHTHQIITVCE